MRPVVILHDTCDISTVFTTCACGEIYSHICGWCFGAVVILRSCQTFAFAWSVILPLSACFSYLSVSSYSSYYYIIILGLLGKFCLCCMFFSFFGHQSPNNIQIHMHKTQVETHLDKYTRGGRIDTCNWHHEAVKWMQRPWILRYYGPAMLKYRQALLDRRDQKLLQQGPRDLERGRVTHAVASRTQDASCRNFMGLERLRIGSVYASEGLPCRH